MDGQKYEKYCAGWLKKHGYRDISLTRASGDQGIDILAYRHGKLYGFQCKYYERPVGNKAVQEAYAGAAFYDCDFPAVITNNRFTKSAQELAQETDVILLDHVDPDVKEHHFRLYQYLSILISFTGIWEFSQYNRHPGADAFNLLVWSCLALITGGLCGLYAEKQLFLNLLAVILDTTYLFMDIRLHPDPGVPTLLFWCLVLILDGLLAITMIRHLRRNNKQNAKQMKREIQQEINEQVNLLGKHLERLLADELHCTVSLQSAKQDQNGNSIFVFHASKDVHEDLPLIEYSFNQYARHDHTGDVYAFVSESSRSFTLTVSKDQSD